ncbi:molybdenum cofactor guanylyltransferase [Bacillus piscicola]|uniref:molybdenum cofactor guanylyltransferase n=1 Tax=Bacillus piscicola TaxID=1632684 RepID=UPI001F08F662|nr:molybdenum cofactor guanylyltransferase [Bacillus piscicola]
MKITGVVLAGGKSSRYGKLKMFETYKELPFYEHSVNAFDKAGIQNIYISTNKELAPSFDQRKVGILVEECQHEGPLYGLAWALRALQDQADWIFLLPSDTPFITSEFVKTMISNMLNHQPPAWDAFIPKSGTKLQPLHGVYHTRNLEIIEKLLDQNKRSMYPLIQSIHYQDVYFEEDQSDFTNINYPEDWKF